MPVLLRHEPGNHGPDRPVHIPDVLLNGNRLPGFNGGLHLRDQLQVERTVQFMVLLLHAPDRAVGWRTIEDLGEIEASGLPEGDCVVHLQPVGTPDHLVHGAESELRHDLPRFLGNKSKEIHQVFRASGEELPQGGILGRHADRAGVVMALAHHHTAQHHQRGGRESVFLGPQQCRHYHIAAGLDLPVGLQADPPAEIVQHQRLLGFGQSQLPRRPGMFDGGPRRGAGAPIKPADQHHVGVGLPHAGGNRANPEL